MEHVYTIHWNGLNSAGLEDVVDTCSCSVKYSVPCTPVYTTSLEHVFVFRAYLCVDKNLVTIECIGALLEFNEIEKRLLPFQFIEH